MFPLLLNKFKNIIVVSNWRSKINFKCHLHVKVCDNFINDYQNELSSKLNSLINIPLDSIVLCSASSLTNILGHKLYLLRPDLTFLDVGTSMNDLFSLENNTRVYHELLNRFKDYSPPLKFINLLINDLLIKW